MYEYLGQFKPVYTMELPNSQSPVALELWTKEVIKLKEKLESHFEVTITDEAVREQVKICLLYTSTNCFCHQWTFEAIPSARTSEYGNQSSFAKFSHGTQYLFQTVWCMGIVTKYRNTIFAHTNFGSARHTRAAAYCLHTLCKGKSTAHKLSLIHICKVISAACSLSGTLHSR